MRRHRTSPSTSRSGTELSSRHRRCSSQTTSASCSSSAEFGIVRPMLGQAVTARACANIALVKYWGKRDSALNLPATGSLSLTLAALATQTSVAFDPALAQDELELDGF